MRTQAGLWIDDDLQFHPDDIELGFRSYRQFGSARHQIAGYSGRLAYPSAKKEGTWIYDNHAALYSMILTNAAWLDKTMLDWFWSDDQRIHDSIVYVDKHMNCEDILMNCKEAFLFTRSVLRADFCPVPLQLSSQIVMATSLRFW
jgi:hypothetical protein